MDSLSRVEDTVCAKLIQSCPIFRQEYWSGLSCPPPGNFSDPGIKPVSLTPPALAGRFFATSTTWEAQKTLRMWLNKIILDSDKWPKWGMYYLPISALTSYCRQWIKQHRLIFLLFWRPEIWNGFRWAKIKLSAVLCSFLGTHGENLSLNFPTDRGYPCLLAPGYSSVFQTSSSCTENKPSDSDSPASLSILRTPVITLHFLR